MPTVSSRTIWTLYFIVFVDIFQVTFVFPILPKIVQDYGKGATEIGLLGSVAAGAEALASPVLGSLSDRYGRRPVLITAMLGSMIDAAVLGLSGSYAVVMVARLVGGICGGTGGVVMAYLAEVTSEEERPSYTTWFMASIFAGAAVGPAIAGVIESTAGWRAACFAASAICALNFVCTSFFLPPNPGVTIAPAESTPEGEQGAAAAEPAPAPSCWSKLFGGCVKYFSLPLSAWLVCTSNFFASIGWTAFEAIGVLYVQDTYFKDSPNPEDPATLFYSKVISGAGVVGLVTNLFIYERFARVTGMKGSIMSGGVVKAMGFAGIALTSYGIFPGQAKWWFFAFVQVLIFGDQIQCTSIQTMITLVVEPAHFGKAMGLMNSCSNLARALGPFSFGPVYEHGGHTTPWWANVACAILAAMAPQLVRLKPAAAPCEDAEAREVVPGAPDAPGLFRQISGRTTRSMLTNLPKLVRAYSAEAAQEEGDGLRRRLTWGAGPSPPLTSMQRSSTHG